MHCTVTSHECIRLFTHLSIVWQPTVRFCLLTSLVFKKLNSVETVARPFCLGRCFENIFLSGILSVLGPSTDWWIC